MIKWNEGRNLRFYVQIAHEYHHKTGGVILKILSNDPFLNRI